MAIEDVKKIGIFYRLLCALISLSCLIALAGVFAFGRDGNFYLQMLIFVAVIGLFIYSTGRYDNRLSAQFLKVGVWEEVKNGCEF